MSITVIPNSISVHFAPQKSEDAMGGVNSLVPRGYTNDHNLVQDTYATRERTMKN